MDDFKIKRNIALASVAFLLVAGTIYFKYLEGWSWINSFYFVVATSATVGYGDVAPQTELGRLSAGIFIIIMVPIILYSFTIIAEGYFQRRIKHKNKKNNHTDNSSD